MGGNHIGYPRNGHPFSNDSLREQREGSRIQLCAKFVATCRQRSGDSGGAQASQSRNFFAAHAFEDDEQQDHTLWTGQGLEREVEGVRRDDGRRRTIATLQVAPVQDAEKTGTDVPPTVGLSGGATGVFERVAHQPVCQRSLADEGARVASQAGDHGQESVSLVLEGWHPAVAAFRSNRMATADPRRVAATRARKDPYTLPFQGTIRRST